MKELCRLIDIGSCPNCGHKQFIVYHSNIDLYLTNGDGEIIDSSQISEVIQGMCIRCKAIYNMMPTVNGYIPMTKLRELFFCNRDLEYDKNKVDNYIENPMEMTKNDN